MKRRVLRICVFVLLGAIVNVAVAWGCAAWLQGRPLYDSLEVNADEWLRQVPADWPAAPDISFSYSRLGSTMSIAACGGLGTPTTNYQQVNTFGFPCRTIFFEDHYAGWCSIPRVIPGQPMMPRWVPGQAKKSLFNIYLPTRPIWPGFAINTVFYAAGLWMLFAAPFALRRRMRIKRGLCPKCAYPVGTNVVCTECGAAVARDTMMAA